MILITGGIRSGKSSFALARASDRPAPRIFIAAGVPSDEEMKARIDRHRLERGDRFILREEPLDIFAPLRTEPASVYLIDCITTWVNNLLYHRRNAAEYAARLLDSLTGREIIITNEVGSGVIPDNALAREYLEELGNINKALAQRADEVFLMVSGIPLRIK